MTARFTCKSLPWGAARAADSSFALVYTPTDRTLAVRLEKIGRGDGEGTVQAWWFYPRTGKARTASTFPNRGTQTFDPPGAPGHGNDWVLVLDDPAAEFPLPGAR